MDLERIKPAVAKQWSVSKEALSRSRGGEDKKAAIYLARKLTRLTGREIGAAFGVKLARVSNVVTELEGEGRQRLWKRVERLRRKLDQST